MVRAITWCMPGIPFAEGGPSVDMADPYITYDNRYIESVWWLLSQLYSKNLLYKVMVRAITWCMPGIPFAEGGPS